MTVVKLTKNILRAHLPQVIELENLVLEEFGDVYSEERWSEENFLFDLPGKWDYSRLALDEEGKCQGFWIASAGPHQSVGVYSHRVAVKKGLRRSRIAQRMFLDISDDARRNGFRRMTLSVCALNIYSIAFYEALGFTRLMGEGLMNFAEHKGLKAKVVNDYLQEKSGHRKLVYALSL